MTDKQTPPDLVLIEAAKRCDWVYCDLRELRDQYETDLPYAVICDMIQKHEPPVDPLVAVAESLGYFNTGAQAWADDVRAALEAQGLEIKALEQST